ncbi:LacI family transcription regulator [Pontibacillus halophilus JSM 076056 = DSM 19796]|uniref:LacI family transcription regulator n=1 Tax=Pontibacillus halophilus JSM 076056 = DSM 19796 TaxID=1385510 RepID=A0A0A5GJE0_9BACI|nr:LacI family DNA-binding transcriptional regulator [Pontibacillus halophilus]KGX92099.1 LacI family transcription regulator [Pontibacillus halophilus JSM 076056 = DSM 19796]
MATIDDVARLAGLSKSTVSRVINEYPHVSKKKRQQVKEAMEMLGYVPNSSARSLRNKKTGILAIFVPRLMNPFFSELVEHVEVEASKQGYQLVICQTHYSTSMERTHLELLRKRQVDAVLLTSLQSKWEDVSPFLEYGPLVFCNEFEEGANVPVIRLDQEAGGYLATKHLLELGHERLAYCCGGSRSNVARYRESGFRRAIAEYGLSFNEHHAFRYAYSIEDGMRVLDDLLCIKPAQRPTAVFTGSDEVAAGVIAAAKVRGVTVPRDLAVVGFDNQAITRVTTPQITTVSQPIHAIAERSVTVLINKLHTGLFREREDHELGFELIVRGSTCSSTTNVYRKELKTT